MAALGQSIRRRKQTNGGGKCWTYRHAALGQLPELHMYLYAPATPTAMDWGEHGTVQCSSAKDLAQSGESPDVDFDLVVAKGEAPVATWTHQTEGWTAYLGDTALHVAYRNKQLGAARVLYNYAEESCNPNKLPSPSVATPPVTPRNDPRGIRNALGETPEQVPRTMGRCALRLTVGARALLPHTGTCRPHPCCPMISQVAKSY